jgi:hypothetical protein
LELGCLMSMAWLPQSFYVQSKNASFHEGARKKIQLLLWIWFKDVLCISVNAITPVY